MTALAVACWVLVIVTVLWFGMVACDFHTTGQQHASKNPCATRAAPEQMRLKTGDLVLFANGSSMPPFYCSVKRSFFTHVGLVYQDPHDDEWYILQSSPDAGCVQSRFRDRVSLDRSGHGGVVAIRPLNRSLQEWQFEAMRQTIESLNIVSRMHDHDLKQGSWASTQLATRTFMSSNDFVLHLLQKAMIVRSDVPDRRVTVNWFQSNGINEWLLLSEDYGYVDELIEIVSETGDDKDDEGDGEDASD